MRSGTRSASAVLGALFLAKVGNGAELGEVRIRYEPYSPAVKLSVQADLVDAGVTVRDRRGATIGGFAVSDFELFDSGKPQPIRFFSEQKADQARNGESPPPTAAGAGVTGSQLVRSIALYFEDTHAGQYETQQAKAAAEKLVNGGFTAAGSSGNLRRFGRTDARFHHQS